ncbi:hypothetical protein ACRAWF_38750 [Streptomyces sp. L7]
MDDLVLQIPAHTLIRTDASLIPLRGKEALLSLDHRPDMDFRTPKRLGPAVIDACFADLAPGPGGRSETVLERPRDRSRTTGVAARRVHARVHRRHPGPGPAQVHRTGARRGTHGLLQPPRNSPPPCHWSRAGGGEFRFGVAYVPSVARGLSRPLSPPAPAPASDPTP